MRLTFVALLLVGLSVLISYLGEAPLEYEPVEVRELKPIERQSTTDVDESPRKEVLEAHEADLTPALEKRVITSDMLTQAVLPLVLSPVEETAAPEVVIVVEEAPVQKASSVLPLEEADGKVAVHVVCRENVFWSTLEDLKKAGASSILVLPIEKMLS